MPYVTRVELGDLALAVTVWPAPEAGRTPVLLLSGTGATAQDWDEVAAALSRSRPVQVVELRGHGGSDWPGAYSLELLAADVVRLLDRTDEPPLDLVGHSLGGLVACRVAGARPARVRRLVLEDVGLPHPRPAATPVRPPGPLDFDWKVVEQVRPEIDDPDPGWPELMASISASTLLIGGGEASFVPQAHLRELVRVLADGRLETVEAGHLVHRTRPAQFLDHLTAFLDG